MSAQDTAGRKAPHKAFGGVWVGQGPGPTTDGQVENLPPGDEVVGAINTAAAHPQIAGVLYAGAVNGGIWKTTNATAASPSWIQQTDAQSSLSIGALEFDPMDPSYQTLVAGIGGFSSFGITGARSGLLRTTNGGATWVPIDGGGTLVDKNISGVAARGSTLVVSVNFAIPFSFGNIGVWRSTDGGATFSAVSIGNGSATGLPDGAANDLAGDPGNPSRLFTGVRFADLVGGVRGIYRSDDTGATWTRVSNAAMETLMATDGNFEISVGNSGNVYVAIVNGATGQLSGVFHSADSGTNWTQMDLPLLADGGIHPGTQGNLHLSIAADPFNANLVYIGGDRQSFPAGVGNAIGATDFSGRLFRGDASQQPGSQWVHLTHSSALGPAGGGTATSSAPHADSRQIVFLTDGTLVETDDGGIYRRTSPQTNTGDWFSIIGDLQSTEFHNLAYDSNADLLIGGAQDTGTPEQNAPGDPSWRSVSTADGGDIAVDDTSTPGLSVRYSSFQNLGAFRRRTFNAANVLQSQVFPSLTVIGGGTPFTAQFTTPVVLNTLDPTRLILAGGNALYESFDQGDTITELTPAVSANGGGRDAIAYGAADNADILYVGSGSMVYVRTAAPPAALVESLTYPGGGAVAAIVVDPQSSQTAYVVDADGAVYRTLDGGGTWADITGDLGAFSPGVLRSAALLPDPNGMDDFLAVGTNMGVLAASARDGFATWSWLGQELPNVPVFELDYDATDDLLAAGTMGRGAWTLPNAFTVLDSLLFTDGFESGDAVRWSVQVP